MGHNHRTLSGLLVFLFVCLATTYQTQAQTGDDRDVKQTAVMKLIRDVKAKTLIRLQRLVRNQEQPQKKPATLRIALTPAQIQNAISSLRHALSSLSEQSSDYPKIIAVVDKDNYWHPTIRKLMREKVLSLYEDLPPIFHETKVRRIIISPAEFANGSFFSLLGFMEDITIYMPVNEKSLDQYIALSSTVNRRPARHYEEFRRWATSDEIEADIAIHEFLHAFEYDHPDIEKRFNTLRFSQSYPLAQAERAAADNVFEAAVNARMTVVCSLVSPEEQRTSCIANWKNYFVELISKDESKKDPMAIIFTKAFLEAEEAANQPLYQTYFDITQRYQIPSRFYGDMHALDNAEGAEWFAMTGTMVYRYLHKTWPDPRAWGVSPEEYQFWLELFTKK